ncbi:MAG TPA: VIT family protein [Gammaproteobacteria bacterium]
MRHRERHRLKHIGWLRATVLGANDGIISTTSLVLGVAAAGVSNAGVLIAGAAGLIAGAMSMAAGEYVSVSSQADTEKADLERERHELATDKEYEHRELANIYIHRGLSPVLADQVARELMTHDALAAHARDELGILEITKARPVQAALASGASFATGALLPLLTVMLVPEAWLVPNVVLVSLVCLEILGAVAAKIGGSDPVVGAMRVTFWGLLAMGLTAGVGKLFGVVV